MAQMLAERRVHPRAHASFPLARTESVCDWEILLTPAMVGRDSHHRAEAFFQRCGFSPQRRRFSGEQRQFALGSLHIRPDEPLSREAHHPSKSPLHTDLPTPDSNKRPCLTVPRQALASLKNVQMTSNKCNKKQGVLSRSNSLNAARLLNKRLACSFRTM